MEFNKNKFGLALAGTMTIAYVVCALFTAIAPDLALKFLGWMVHLVNVDKFADGTEVTFGTFILGLLPIIFYAYLAGWLFAWMYNRLVKSA